MSEGGEVLYDENIKGKGGVSKTYDLSAFPEGKYFS